jgi:hypothetical protein
MNSFEALKDWQSFVRTLIGAAVSISVAFLVAYINRRREEKSAALVLTGSLVNVRGAHAVLRELAKDEAVPSAEYPMWLASRLASSRPSISPLFDGCVARLMPVDPHLAAHLDLFSIIYRGTEHHVSKLVRDIEYYQQHGKLLHDKKDTTADANVIESGLAKAARHAECAEYLLSKLVIGNWPTVYRIVRRMSSSTPDQECKRLLETGAV